MRQIWARGLSKAMKKRIEGFSNNRPWLNIAKQTLVFSLLFVLKLVIESPSDFGTIFGWGRKLLKSFPLTFSLYLLKRTQQWLIVGAWIMALGIWVLEEVCSIGRFRRGLHFLKLRKAFHSVVERICKVESRCFSKSAFQKLVLVGLAYCLLD